jgi:micrococcal nuclease
LKLGARRTNPFRRASRWSILAAAVAAVVLLVQNSRREPPPAPGYFRVKEVIDGDTVILEGSGILFKARLAGIDAPEMGGKEMPGQPYAAQARDYLASLVRSCELQVRQVGIDDFNRPLVFLRCGDTDVNLRMVETGLAEVYRGRTTLDLTPFFQAEERARRQRLNIWSLAKYESPKEWRRRHRPNASH